MIRACSFFVAEVVLVDIKPFLKRFASSSICVANMLPRIPTVLLALGLLCVLQLSLAQDITCPAELIFISNGSVEYSELPTTTPISIPVYDPGAIGGWYNPIASFVDGIRPGTLPYGKHM